MRTISLIAFFSGLIFGIGLIIGGMTNPAKVLAFLDITGDWDPSLMFVMLGAIAVSFFAFRQAARKSTSLLGWPVNLPDTTRIDRKLVMGAVLFGAGWGLAGFCPGPAMVALLFGSAKPWIFVTSMLAGMWLHSRLFGKG
ncbi:DUF6691 family protein [Methylophilus aquaticus]|uniref:YeeE/YedE family protein n=1 Tax=Methylophilus aquaticus TaxID=1971610 RepID=A0ABT9JW89_9PROT|nr:DUF6691 family protein [Methylophilus aquaticus]MDP8568861.1 YeeE/YedE family protein [Methylophilus aquaticus]